ncbi:MAG: DUF917 domain-containing protein [Alphaproteobacteria bacterium]|nr:DUF917 domain-containing protein [Alphaproteobacteria bacterium]MCW5739879.1 DUF917 domain-containing protein [Alphaproteobacteria bacterium]
MREIQADELEPLAIGAWILGAGGGGNPYLAHLNLRRLYDGGARVWLLDPMELADDDLVATVASIGAPLVGRERLSDPRFAAKPLLAMQKYLEREMRAVMSIEIGGANGLHPLMVAAVTGLPVVDADAMGRAFPEGQMTSFAIAELPLVPLILADIRDNEIVVPHAENARRRERIARGIVAELGSVANACTAPRSGREVKEHGILHTTTKAIRIGRVVEDARRRREDAVAALVEAERGTVLFRGKVQDVERRATAGFLRGRARLLGLDGDRGSNFELEFQNEYAVAWRDGEIVSTTPDIICTMDSESGEAVGTEMVRYGQRITVIALPSPGFFLTPKALGRVGPRGFGYDFDYKSALA